MRIALFLTAIMTCSLLFACTDQEAEKRIQAAEERAVAAEKRAAVAEERLLILEKKITENEERALKRKKLPKRVVTKRAIISVGNLKVSSPFYHFFYTYFL